VHSVRLTNETTKKTPLKTTTETVRKTDDSHLIIAMKKEMTCFLHSRVQMVNQKKKKKKLLEKKLGKTRMKKMMSFDAYFVVVVVVFFQPKNLISARMMDQPRCLNSSS
jgi:uncharacterized membrane protein